MFNINLENKGFKGMLEKYLSESFCIFNDETYNYLNKLINLDESVIRKGAISDEILGGLKKINFFDSIVLYNLYNLVMNYIKDYSNTKILSNMYGFFVQCKDTEKTELLRFINNEMCVYLYSSKPIDVMEKYEQVNLEISNLEQKVDYFEKCDYYVSELQKQQIAKRLHELKQMSLDYIKRQYDISLSEYEKQNWMTERLLSENNLTEKDFENVKIQGVDRFLIKEYPHVKIYIKK